MEQPNFTPIIIQEAEQMKYMENYLLSNDSETVAIDTETDGLLETKVRLFGIGLCIDTSCAFYIAIRNKDGDLLWSPDQLKRISTVIYKQCLSRKLIMHNGVYDCLVLKYTLGLELSTLLHSDTMLLKHTAVNEEQPLGLKTMAVQYLGPWADKSQKELYENIKQNGGTTTREAMQMFKADTAVLGAYCCFDVLLTFMLYRLFAPQLVGNQAKLYEYEVLPLSKEVIMPMKERGFPVDITHFNKLRKDIYNTIIELENSIQEEILPLISEYCENTVKKAVEVKTTGKFPIVYANIIGFELPRKNGKITLAKAYVSKLEACQLYAHEEFRTFLLKERNELTDPRVFDAQLEIYYKCKGNSVFNLGSKTDLMELFFTILKEKPLSKTDGGAPCIDDEFLEEMAKKYNWATKLITMRKLQKLLSTYVEGILTRQKDGIIYTSMLQTGTTSGRFSSRDPNLQNLPRTKEDEDSSIVVQYTNEIRKGFVAPSGYVIVDADYSALEPRCFASASGDENLQAIFHNGEDMYSAIAIRSYNLKGMSSFKKDINFLGKVKPELRQTVKAYCLAAAYGAEKFRISQLLNITPAKAEKLLEDYFKAYPGLKAYIQHCHNEAVTKGKIENRFGRVRHLKDAKILYNEYGKDVLDYQYARSRGLKEQRSKLKLLLNNSTNFPIQSMAASIVNRAMLAIARKFKELEIDGYIALQIHDQIVCIVNEHDQERAKEIVQYCMENTTKIEVPLIAEPKLGYNLKESH